MQFLRIAPYLFTIIVDVIGYSLMFPMIAAIFTSTYSPFFSPQASLAEHNFYLGLGFALYPLTAFFSIPLIQDFSDKFGRRKVILYCMAGIVVSFLLMGLGSAFSNLFLFLLGRALSGLTAGSQPLSQAAISDLHTVEKKHARMNGITWTICIGLVLGPLIGAFFSHPHLNSGFVVYTPFYIVALLAFFAFIWSFLFFHKDTGEKARMKIKITHSVSLFIDVFRRKPVRMLAFVALVFQIGFGVYFQLILVLLREQFAYTSFLLGLFYAFLGVASSVAILWVNRFLAKKLPLETLTTISLLTTAMGLVATAVFSDCAWAIWVLCFPISIANVIAYTQLMFAFSHAADAHFQRWVMGVFSSIIALSLFLSAFATNLLQLVGAHGLIFLGGIFVLVSSLLYFSTFLTEAKEE